MRIAYDVSILEGNELTGVEKLAFNLFSKMWLLGVAHQHILICRERPQCLVNLPGNCCVVETGKAHLWRWFRLRKALKLEGVDAFVSGVTNLTLPIKGLKMYPYAHECQWLYDTNEGGFGKHKFLFQMSTRLASRIITNSHSTAKDITMELKLDRKVDVISPSYDESVLIPSDKNRAQVLKELSLEDGDYYLFVSSIRPKKNIDLLLEAFSKTPNERLLLVGKVLYPEIPEKAKLLGLTNVHFLGYVKDEDVSVLYDNAKAFLYVSKNEGFGLPILEAYAHGCPVIVSRDGSIPEVAGDAAVYIDGDDADELGKVLQGFKRDVDFTQKSATILKKYDWSQSAQKYLEILEKDYAGYSINN
ncbi:mannosyltransferase [Lentisphaera araneosa HTCC2155]|uniref:Mannosyltransferase n=1 Tax=Lentisphaera araneosa HTCC2155 TaxID=313628 RepID=A6DT08_9BACT|nr:glycosyltransferase family 1 protein [Lentisphaera araneosa]EDM25183.1 mannosyltransferase [Lentisphaera araneosa HTCC2155]